MKQTSSRWHQSVGIRELLKLGVHEPWAAAELVASECISSAHHTPLTSWERPWKPNRLRLMIRVTPVGIPAFDTPARNPMSPSCISVMVLSPYDYVIWHAQRAPEAYTKLLRSSKSKRHCQGEYRFPCSFTRTTVRSGDISSARQSNTPLGARRCCWRRRSSNGLAVF